MSAYDTLKGTNPMGVSVETPVSGTIATTTAPLASGAIWSSGWLMRGQFIGAQTTIYSDVNGSYTVEYSEDNGVTQVLPSVAIPYLATQNTRKGAFDISAAWVRFTYTNSSSTQTKFKFEIRFLTEGAQISAETLNALGADSRLAMWTKTRIETKDSGGGTYDAIYRTGNALNVHLDANPTISGSVSVSNFPATQPVSGTIAVNNFPATQPVSASALPLPAGASTSALQTTGNTSLTSIDAKLTPPSNSTTTQVTTLATVTTVLTANANRRGAAFNSVSGTILIKLGTAASATSYTARLVTNGYYEIPPCGYTGAITAIGAGTLLVTEITA